MVELYAHGATIEQIAARLNISTAVFYKLRGEIPEFAKAWEIAREAQEDTLTGKVWEIAMEGYTEEGTEWQELDAKGIAVTKRERRRATPRLPALLAILRRYHGWGKPREKGKQQSIVVGLLTGQALIDIMAQRLRTA